MAACSAGLELGKEFDEQELQHAVDQLLVQPGILHTVGRYTFPVIHHILPTYTVREF